MVQLVCSDGAVKAVDGSGLTPDEYIGQPAMDSEPLHPWLFTRKSTSIPTWAAMIGEILRASWGLTPHAIDIVFHTKGRGPQQWGQAPC